MKEISINDIYRLTEKYGVNIDMSFGKDPKVTVSNGVDIESFYASFSNVTHDRIVKIARSMHIKELERREQIKENLANMSQETIDSIPDNLFDKKTYSLNDKYEEIDDDELFSNDAPLKYQVLSVLSGCMNADHVQNFSLDSDFYIRFMNECDDLSKEDIRMGINILVNEGYLDEK